MELAAWRCQSCGDMEEELNVHHSRYEMGKDPWDYDDSDLTCLCASCHRLAHMNPEKIRKFRWLAFSCYDATRNPSPKWAHQIETRFKEEKERATLAATAKEWWMRRQWTEYAKEKGYQIT